MILVSEVEKLWFARLVVVELNVCPSPKSQYQVGTGLVLTGNDETNDCKLSIHKVPDLEIVATGLFATITVNLNVSLTHELLDCATSDTT